MKVAFSILAGAVLAASQVVAEDAQTVLTNVTSPVLVNQGEAYVQAEEGMALLPGDQLVAMQGGSAQVSYANGCVHQMAGNEVYRISAEDACAMPAAAAVHQAAPSSPGGGGGMSTGDIAGLVVTGAALAWAGYEISDDDDVGPPPTISPE
jgi:hypothetical protein